MSREVSFLTLSGPLTGSFKARGSKFLGFAFHVTDTQQIKEYLDQVRKEHPKANHHCYAYRLGPAASDFRFYDDREPGGSAGRPIFNVLQSARVSDTLLIVVRYFGGTQLGIPGLIAAYKTTAEATLESGKLVPLEVHALMVFEFPVEHSGAILNMVRKSGGIIISYDQQSLHRLTLKCTLDHAKDLLHALQTSYPISETFKLISFDTA